jgi:hypothetical protein
MAALASSGTSSQGPALPAGARTRWIVADPHEIVVYVTRVLVEVVPPASNRRFFTVFSSRR